MRKSLLLIVPFLFIAAPFAHAAGSLSPDTYATPTDSITLTQNGGSTTFVYNNGVYTGVSYFNNGFGIPPFTPTDANGGVDPAGATLTFGNIASAFSLAPCEVSLADCQAVSGYINTFTLTFAGTPPPTPPTGFFDPVAMLASVTEGVQATGVALWPLFTFIGIGLAFAIAIRVIDFIRAALAGRAIARAELSRRREEE